MEDDTHNAIKSLGVDRIFEATFPNIEMNTVPYLKLVEQIVVEAGSPCPMYVVPAGMWHTTEALVSGTIIFESKDGRYGEDGSESWG